MNSGLHEHLKAFVAIAEAGSFTAASIAMGTGQATLSRQLAALEKHLGCRLLNRSTRAVTLTDQGEIYLRHAQRMLELNEEAEAAIQESAGRLRGTLRIACSNAFGRKLLIPSLERWRDQHPQIHIELMLSDGLAHLIEDRVDVAIRLAPLEESTLIARPIGTSRRIVVASREYIKRHGAVRDPSHLQRHQCIVFSGAERPRDWTFTGAKGETTVHVSGWLTLSTVDALQDAVLAGLGVAIMPAWFWTDASLEGKVVQLLPEYTLPEQTIHALTSARHKGSGKVARFIEHVSQVLRNSPTTALAR
jgi:DNA-binding transcriptional LysR family regulator